VVRARFKARQFPKELTELYVCQIDMNPLLFGANTLDQGNFELERAMPNLVDN